MTYKSYDWMRYLHSIKEKCKNKTIDIKKGQSKAAVIIEPRKDEMLELVIYNFMYFLSDDWSLYIIHGTENGEYVKEITKDMGDIYYCQINMSNLDIFQYNSLLTSPGFYDIFHCDNILIFQIDTILRKKIPDSLLQYDYVGAPWSDIKVGNGVGNGGLSLRKVSAIKSVLNNIPYDGTQEDMFISKACYLLNMNLPTYNVASCFAIETYWNEDPIGIHKPLIGCLIQHPEFSYSKYMLLFDSNKL
jgi:hypothetical protein